MRITVTGAAGAVGSFVLDALAADHSLTLFTRRTIKTSFNQLNGDLLDQEACQAAVAGAGAVVHLAACSEPGPDTFAVNTTGTFNMLEAARVAGVTRFIFASTNCVYGHCYQVSERVFPLAYLPIDEAHPVLPEDNYGLSKLLCEQMVALYARNWSMQTAALRLSWVWGPQEIHWRREMEALDLARFAPYFWSYVDGRDVGRAVSLALAAKNLPAGGVYNISSGDTMAEEDTCALVQRFYPAISQLKRLLGRASLLDCGRAERAFGYRALYSWMEDS